MNKKIKKLIVSNLILGIVLSTITINSSFAGTLSLDNRYETFEGSSVEISDILEEHKVDVEIEGNTLINLFDDSNAAINITSKNKFIPSGLTKLKNGTKYTIIPINYPSDITSITLQNEVKGASWWYSYLGKLTSSQPYLITTPDSWLRPGTTSYYTEMRLKITSDRDITEEELKNLKLMIIEGDWTDKEIPQYFEGMKSVGENDTDDCKIEILSHSKNIVKPQVLLNMELGGSVSMKQRNATEEVVIKPNTLYTFTMKESRQQPYIRFYDENKNFIKSYGGGTNTRKVKGISPDNAKYLVCFVYSSDIILDKQNEMVNNEWCVVEGENDTYIPYQFNEKEIVLNKPLRSLPSGASDRIIKKNGQWVIERNCAEIILDSFLEQNPSAIETIGNYSSRIYMAYNTAIKFPNIKKGANAQEIICDRLPSKEVVPNIQTERDMAIGKTGAGVSIRCEGVNLEKCEEWINNNPLTIIYQLETPVYESLKISSSLSLYKEATYITTDSNIPVNLKVTVDRVANRAQEAIKLAKLNPTVQNISIARMWINLMQNSMLKDQFNEDANNIIQIEDLEIEKKKASANLDLYVKSENMLSMSLSTNSVTFENYSGVEDLEILNVVSINVNSSLPYDLNAYLTDEIYNRDKSKSIDIKTLNIREGSKSNYNQFNSVAEKLVLKDNCEAANGIVHNIDLKLSNDDSHDADVYKTTIKFEIEQK